MNIRHLKKAMKKSSGFLTLKLRKYFYSINEWDRIEYHKRHIIIYGTMYGTYTNDDFITFFYTDIRKVYIHK